MELIEKYFGGELTPLQRERFVRLYDLYAEWNARINVVSRKDFDSLYLKHVLHSLAIACACRFDGGAQVCDVGTGGGSLPCRLPSSSPGHTSPQWTPSAKRLRWYGRLPQPSVSITWRR